MSEDSEEQAPNAKDQTATHKMVPGFTVEKPSCKFTVTSVENDKVRFSYESPSGTVRSSLPLNTFRKMVGTEGAVAQYQPSLATNTEPRAAIEEFSPEDLAEFRRLEAMYRSLSQGDRYYIVSRWDDEQGLEPTYKRENYRNEVPRRVRRRNFWTVVALIPASAFILWIGRLVQADRERYEDSFVLDSLRERSTNIPALKSAIDEADREYRELIESQRPE